jgi:asparagine synthase (glutamine-hydrolysing)
MRDTAQLIGDEGGNVAAHVSGGLDSTAVAIITAPMLNSERSPIVCVASWSPDPSQMSFDGDDERDRVRAVAESLGVPAIFTPATSGEESWLAALDVTHQPRSTLRRESHLLPQFAELTVQHVLSGWGGDEFASFNGRGTHRALLRRGNIRELHASYRAFRDHGRPPHLAARYVLAPAAPAWLLTWQERRKGERSRPHLDAAQAEAYPDLAASATALNRKLERAASARAMQLGLLELGHLARRIEAWHEAGLRFGVTYHYPLLDVRIVEWALSMPPEVWRIGGQSRRVFRLAIEGLVPDYVRFTAKDDPALFALAREAREAAQAAADQSPQA